MPRTLGLARGLANFADSASRSYLRMREDERRQERHDISSEVDREEAQEKLENIRHKRGARATATAAAAEWNEQASRPRMLGTVGGPGMSGLPQGDANALADSYGAGVNAEGNVQGPAQPAESRHFYTARKVADFHRSRGRDDEAQKVLTRAYLDAIAENEARFNFELMPRMQELRKKNLDADALKSDRNFQTLQWDIYQTSISQLGHIYGLLKTGNKEDAVRAFNASGVVMPGTQVADVRVEQGQDGTPMVIAYDKDGKVVTGKDGQPIARPQAWFERVWSTSQQQTIKLGKGESIVNVTKNPDGTLKATPAYTNPDPDQARRVERDTLAADKAWSEAINKSRDDASKYLRDTLGLTPNALGQVMNPDNQPVFERALPKVTTALQAARAAGKKLDQLDGVAIAKDALKEARDEWKREKAGAGPRSGASSGGPTVKDIIGGGN